MSDEKKIVLVTGGSGLVGQALKTVIEQEKPNDENWIFIGSKDGDLRYLFSIMNYPFFSFFLNEIILYCSTGLQNSELK
jgi:hypothetical protein